MTPVRSGMRGGYQAGGYRRQNEITVVANACSVQRIPVSWGMGSFPSWETPPRTLSPSATTKSVGGDGERGWGQAVASPTSILLIRLDGSARPGHYPPMMESSGLPVRGSASRRASQSPRPFTRARLWAVAGSLTCALASTLGCTSFKAVQSTGALAKGLSSHADSIAYVESMCVAIQAATSSGTVPDLFDEALGTDQCGSIGEDAEAWARVVEALAGYGKALDGLASSKAVDLSAELEGIRTGLAGLDVDSLGTDRAKAAVGAASRIIKLITREIRRKALQDAITKAAPHVEVITAQLDAHIDQQLTTLARLEDNLSNPAADLIAPNASEDVVVCGKGEGETEIECDARDLRLAVSAALFTLQGWTHERRLALQSMRSAVSAFAEAHAVLANDADSIGSKDAEHLAKIIDRIKAIYEQGKVAIAPEASETDEDPDPASVGA